MSFRALRTASVRLTIILVAAGLTACSEDGPVQTGPVDEAPILALAPTSVTLDAVAGDADPAADTVDVTNAGDGTLGGLDAGVAYGDGQPTGWLTATLDGSAAPAGLIVSASAAGLSAGTFDAVATVASDDAENDSVSVDVAFTVQAAPAIALSDDSVAFEATEGGADPADATVAVTNGGGGTLDGLGATVAYADGQPTGWLTASLDTAVAPATLTLRAATGSLTAGAYDATVDVASDAADDGPRVVTVSLTVAPPPMPDLTIVESLAVTPDSVAAGDTVEYSTWTLRNQGSAEAAATAVGFYLSTDSVITAQDTRIAGDSSAVIAAGAEEVWPADSLAIPAGTSAGSYHIGILVDEQDSIAESDEANNVRSAPLTVTDPEPAPSIALSTSTVAFQATEGGPDPADETVDVTNAGGGTLDGLGTTVAYGDGQPTGWLTASLDATTAPATLTLSAATGSLTAGAYDATVDVTSGVADNSPQTVTVSLDVQAQGDTATPLEVVINEVNWFGNGSDATDEWIELRNTTGAELNLSGWTIDAAGTVGTAVTIDDGTVLAAGEYLVIGAKQGPDAAGERTSLTGVANVQIQPVSLSNAGEQLVLRDVEGTVIDSTPSGGWPAGNETTLYSMERYDDITGGGYGAGDTAGSWYTWVSGSTDTTHPDTADSGTPGAHNSDPF